MTDEVLDKVVEHLSTVIPLINRGINRKLIKPVQIAFNADISPLHFLIMKILDEEEDLHVTEIGEKVQINRPQMTYLIDQLVCLNLVEREPGTEDRRTINVSITRKGKSHLIEHDRLIKDVFRTALSGLSGKEVEELLASLINLRDIFSKLE